LLNEARRKVADLERQIAEQQAVPTGELQESSAKSGFRRKTRKLRWRIYYDLCERPDRVAVRYPDGVSSVCDECLQGRASPALHAQQPLPAARSVRQEVNRYLLTGM